jgi:hypothetical protein
MSTGLRPTEGRPATDGSWRVTVGLALTRGLVAQHSGRWSRSEALGLELDNIGQRYGDSGALRPEAESEPGQDRMELRPRR